MAIIKEIKKRNGQIASFDQEKITNAIFKALTATNQGDGDKSKELSNKVSRIAESKFKDGEIPQVEQIQNIVEDILISEGLIETAKAYILYREQRRRIRESEAAIDESTKLVDKYIQELDWQIHENANMTYSLQGLNQYIISSVAKKYWLNKIYPKEIREAAINEDFHIHNLDTISCYCMGWDLYDLLIRGFGGVAAKIESKPAKHFKTALGQLVNFFYTLQGECYSKDTQVLTDSGWKYFYDVDKEDKIFTLNNETNEIELQKPVKSYEFDYDGDLYNFKTKKLDLLVTPNHNMIVDQYCPKCKTGQYSRKFIKAKDFKTSEHFIPKSGGIWKGKRMEVQYISSLEMPAQVPLVFKEAAEVVKVISNSNEFLLPSIEIQQYRNFANSYEIIKIEEKKIVMDDWLMFFGFWIAEGCVYQRKRISEERKKPYYEYAIRISQNKGKTADEFEKVLKRLPFNYNKKDLGKKIEFVICNKQLFSYLRQFGKAGDKFIPQDIKNLSQEQLKILFDWMMKGDGYIGGGNIEYSTKSKRLADDFQEIVLKLGHSANIQKRSKGKFRWYDISLSMTRHFKFRKGSIEKIYYKGKVYCLEVPNHTLYVRREGKACWCGNSAGAQAVSNFDTLLAPFIKYDGLSYHQVKQAMQEFLFNCSVPTRTGFQTPFLNVSLDIKPPKFLAEQPVVIGGEAKEETYGEFQEEMNMFNRAFYECLMEGDAKGRPFTFPIPTVSIGDDFNWDNPALEAMWEATAKYGVNYFQNFVKSDMNPEDFRSMCCRLRLSNKELYKRGGGLFGSAPLTGSIGVVTINMPRIGYLSKTKNEFFERLKRLMDLAMESLEIKRKTLDNFMEKGLYPYSRYYLSSIKKIRNTYYGNHFSTIGLIGMNETSLNFIGKNIGAEEGRNFSLEVLDYMRNELVKYQEETGHLYNLEATPAEGTSYRQAKADKERYPDIITSGTKEIPFYTNSTQLPVNYTDDVFEALKLQDDLQCKYTGGCIEKGNKVLTDKGLLPIEQIVKTFEKLKPIKVLSYNSKKNIAEWDKIVKAVSVDVKKHNKIRIKGERNLDITTSDWHPFFILEKFKPNQACPICMTKVKNIKAFASHIHWNSECREKYQIFPKYQVAEKRADELRKGDYILQNSYNLYPDKEINLNNDLMRLIGFFIGDGSISKFIDNRGGNNLERYKVRFFSEHKEALKKIVEILNKYFQCYVKVIKNDKRSKVLREVSTSKKEVSEFFFKYGFQAGEKTYNIYIPQKVKENFTKENIFSFLSGLIDSDGHISKRDGDFEYYTVSEKLAEDILEICSRAGIMISKSLKPTKRRNEVDIWRLRIPKYEMTKIKNQLSNSFYSSRIENQLANRKKRYLPVVRVKKVSKVDAEDNQFYDLMTEKNHNYLAGKNCLVFIHNTVMHLFLGEKIYNVQAVKNLVKKIFENFHLAYITLTPTFSICPTHGYIAGEHFDCPKCAFKQPCEVYSRVVGYLRPVSQYNIGKQQEFRERKTYKIEDPPPAFDK